MPVDTHLLDPVPWGSLIPVALWMFVLIALTAVFVAGEYGFLLVRRTRVMELAEQGNAAARTVLKTMEDPQSFLAAVQIGITVTSLALGAFTEQPLTELFKALLGQAQLTWLAGAAHIIGVVLALTVASYFHVVLGELVPRALTLQRAERIALTLVPPLHVIAGLIRPAAWLFKTSSLLVLRLFGVKELGDHAQLHSADEIRMLVEQSERGGLIDGEQSEMLSNVFSFGDTTVREVMVPRTEMVCVDVDASLQAIARVFAAHSFSRVPVYEDSPDKIIGTLHSRDMLRALLTADRTRLPGVRQMMREPYYVPDSQRADELLTGFRARRENMAVVLDEFGGTAGLVTLNDLVGRIFGEFEDSARPSAPDFQQASDGSSLIAGLASIGDVNDAFGLAIADENYDTIGGYVMGRLGRIPKVGDVVEVNSHVHLHVLEMDKLRVARLRFERATQA